MKRNGERELKRGLNAEERSYLITAVVVACAIAARVISKAGIAADTMGLIRSVLYIGLYFVWGRNDDILVHCAHNEIFFCRGH